MEGNTQDRYTFMFGKLCIDFIVRDPLEEKNIRIDNRKYLQPIDEKEATSICEILKNESVSHVSIKVALFIKFFF